MKKLLSVFLIFTLVTPAFGTSLTCAQLEEKIVEAQNKVNNAKVGDDKVSFYIKEIKKLDEMHQLADKILLAKTKYTSGSASFLDDIYGTKNPLQDPILHKNLSAFTNGCEGDNVDDCASALFRLTQKDVERMSRQEQALKDQLSALNNTPAIQDLMLLSQNYANEYKQKKCHAGVIEAAVAKVEDKSEEVQIQCEAQNESKIDMFGSDVMDVIINSNENPPTQKSREELCKSLTGTEYALAGCVPEDKQCAHLGKNFALENNVCVECKGSTKHIYQSVCYTCPKNHSVVHGECKIECSKLEARQAEAPYECVADVAAEKANNLRKVRRKEKWGNVLRTSAIIAVAGGAAIGLAFAFKAIFKNYFNSTENNYTITNVNPTFSSPTYNAGNSSSSYSNPNYNYYGMGMNQYGAGYSNYFQNAYGMSNNGYYNPYGSSPYGWY
ncbi:MAG: hypothetical protein ACOYL6_06755 [Bacteriovoracaceae bacterium]